MKNWIRSCVAIAFVLGCVGCSGGSGSGTSTSSGVSGQGAVSASTGGTITVTDPTSPIKGATVTVPPGAVASGDVQISITHQDTPPGPLPPEAVAAGAIVVSKTIVLTKDRPGTFDQPLTITVPYDAGKLDPEDFPTVLYWDPATTSYSPVAVIAFDSATGMLTFQTVHFSSFAAVAGKAFGKIVSQTTVDTGFRPSVDGFYLRNFASWSSPGGNCLGMAAYSSWYFGSAKIQNGPLYQKFRKAPPDLDNEIIGKELIARAFVSADQQRSWSLTNDMWRLGQAWAGRNLIQAMRFTKQPAILLVQGVIEKDGTSEVWAHALVIYRYDAMAQRFYIYNPNQPARDDLYVNFDGSKFSGITVELPSAPTAYGFDAYNAVYDPADMQKLLDDSKKGWNESEFGKINISSLSFDPSQARAIIPTGANVLLKGTITPDPCASCTGPDPNRMDVSIGGGFFGDFPITSRAFDTTLPLTPVSVAEIWMVAGRRYASLPDSIGYRLGSIYGFFRQFEIVVGGVQFSAPTYAVSQTTGPATITVTRTGDASSTGEVKYETSNGTAVAGQDYTPTTGTLTFNANETSKTFTVPILNNPASQGDRTVNLTLSQPSAGTMLGTQPTAVLTIRAAPSSLGTTFIGVSGASLETILLTPRASGGYDIAVTPIPNAGINPYPGRIASLAYAPYNKLVTGFTNRVGGPNNCCHVTGIEQINPSTGALTPHVEVESGHSLGSHVNALAVTADGNIYLAGGPQLVPLISSCGINRTCNFLLHFRDSQSFPDGPDFLNLVFTPGINITALAVSPTGLLYGWDQKLGLVTVKPFPWTSPAPPDYLSDAVTQVSAQGRPLAISYDNPIISIQFTDDGKLIGIQDDFNAPFYEIDTSSGSVTLIGRANGRISSFARMPGSAPPSTP